MSKTENLEFPKERIIRISMGINEVVISSSNEKDNLKLIIQEAKKIMKDTNKTIKPTPRNTDIR